MWHLLLLLPMALVGQVPDLPKSVGQVPDLPKSAPFDPLPLVDLSKLSPRDFADAEIDLPYYLAHFRQFADAVIAEGPNRGFIGISVWRGQTGDKKPYNARVMENILSLAYFYTLKRPWNPYYGSVPVRQRLEAALEFWCRIQSPDGKFSEYGQQQWNLAATAFATKFMGRALALLKDGPPIDRELHHRAIEADRKAIRIVLTDPDFYEHGKRLSNQFTNVWAGGPAFFRLYPDAELESLFWKRLPDSLRDFQSPAGFFYEADGPDAGYSSSTHQSNLRVAYVLTRGTDRAKPFLEHDRRWFEWLAWNAVPEPGGGWTLNRAIETRQKHAFFSDLTTPLAERIPLARAFATNTAEHKAELVKARQEGERDWPSVPPLPVGEFRAYAPYAFLDRDQFEWRPSQEQQAAARRTLPYIERTRFAHQLMDSRNPIVSTYIRQPLYYAAFNSGKHLRDQQRYGLGLLWNPKSGAVLQSQTASDTAAWGTQAEPWNSGDSQPIPTAGIGGSPRSVYESGDVNAVFEAAGRTVTPQPGSHDLAGGTVSLRYPLGAGGEKSVRFDPDRIMIQVRHPGRFTEVIPLLADTVKIALGEQSAEIPFPGGTFRVEFGHTAKPELVRTPMAVGKKHVEVLRLRAENELEYSLVF